MNLATRLRARCNGRSALITSSLRHSDDVDAFGEVQRPDRRPKSSNVQPLRFARHHDAGSYAGMCVALNGGRPRDSRRFRTLTVRLNLDLAPHHSRHVPARIPPTTGVGMISHDP
jgi:hypothetical protein